MSNIKKILNKVSSDIAKSKVELTDDSPRRRCFTNYVLCLTCPGPLINPIYVGNENDPDNQEDLIDTLSVCRERGGIARQFTAVHYCDEVPDVTEQLTEDYLEGLMEICDSTGRCCIGFDTGDGCDPIPVGCQNLTANECRELGESYQDTGIITYWVGDQGVFAENSNCEDEGQLCFDENYDNDNIPENFQYCCVPGNPYPVPEYQDGLPMTKCRCGKIGGYEFENEDLREDICGNIVCPDAVESQNEVIGCCVKFDTGYSCVELNRCECDASRIDGAISATVMENGCFDNPDYPQCNCCERNTKISTDYDMDDPPLKSV